jgi:ketosteroid isomerase-like protein
VHYRIAILASVLGATVSCTIQPTPREYIDRELPASAVRQQTLEALEDQIARLIHALNAGDDLRARSALSPAPDAVVLGPAPEHYFSGATQIAALLDVIAARDELQLELTDLEVTLTPRGSVAWFHASLELSRPDAAEPLPLRTTGIYVEREGIWELRQAHLSIPVDTLTVRPPARGLASPPEAE